LGTVLHPCHAKRQASEGTILECFIGIKKAIFATENLSFHMQPSNHIYIQNYDEALNTSGFQHKAKQQKSNGKKKKTS